MPMKGWMIFFTSQNTAGVKQEKGTAAIFQTIKANGDQVSNFKKHLIKP